MKRSCPSSLPAPKRKPLVPVNQLATPPTTPEKNHVVDISAHISGHGRKLNLQNSVYTQAKALFQRGAKSSFSSRLVGREAEANAFELFLHTSVSSKVCNSLYISGPPGTGKTAQVNLTLDNFNATNVKVMRVNCMTVSRPENIFHEMYTFFTGSPSGRKKGFADLHSLLANKTASAGSFVVVLDEMDYLITKDQQVLFQLFNCASRANSSALTTKLVVIGISNALDLTDKFLPRLRSNGLNPQPLQFLPYTADQIKLVVTAKLASLDEQDKENVRPARPPLMHPGAIQMCCKKCAAVTGDLRKAFDICYKSIEFVETQARKQENFLQLTLDTAPKVLISHVAKVCALMFGDSSQQKIKNLNLLQKAVLCCIFNCERSSLANRISINELYDHYCKKSLPAIDNFLGRIKKGEFLEIVGALESASAVIIADNGKYSNMDSGNKQIRPNVLYADVERGIEEAGVLKKILLA